MQYIYDVMLNFNDIYYEFYEWKKSDKLISVKKIPLYKVDSDVIYDFMYNDIVVSKEFIDNIYDLTMFYKDYDYKYMCLFSDGNKSVGVMFDSDGKLIKRSSLSLEEEDEVNDESFLGNVNKINYNVINVNKDIYISRIDRDRYNYLYRYISKLDNYDILRYIYYDYFEEENSDADGMKVRLINVINEGSDNKLYDIVKMFKKIKN